MVASCALADKALAATIAAITTPIVTNRTMRFNIPPPLLAAPSVTLRLWPSYVLKGTSASFAEVKKERTYQVGPPLLLPKCPPLLPDVPANHESTDHQQSARDARDREQRRTSGAR